MRAGYSGDLHITLAEEWMKSVSTLDGYSAAEKAMTKLNFAYQLILTNDNKGKQSLTLPVSLS